MQHICVPKENPVELLRELMNGPHGKVKDRLQELGYWDYEKDPEYKLYWVDAVPDYWEDDYTPEELKEMPLSGQGDIYARSLEEAWDIANRMMSVGDFEWVGNVSLVDEIDIVEVSLAKL